MLLIGFLVIVLIIPSAWIQELIRERQSRAEGALAEMSDKWAGSQTLSGPVLVIPYVKRETVNTLNKEPEIKETEEKAFFLPESFRVDGELTPTYLHRGMFDAVVYRAALQMNADFSSPDFSALGISETDVQWDKAQLVCSLSDMAGLGSRPVITVDNDTLSAEPTSDIGFPVTRYLKQSESSDDAYDEKELRASTEYVTLGLYAPLHWKTAEDFNGKVSMNLAVKGSQRLNFVPVGKSTSVHLKGPWGNPSFDGQFIPETRVVDESSFTAQWNVSHFNRPFSQQWKGLSAALTQTDFGLRLLVPVEQYQKSMRTAKYSHLIVILTFVALFLLELTQKLRIHAFQYTLIGAALVIYYTLLLSFSEQVGYTWAYVIATVATVALIAMYASSFLKQFRLVVLLTTLMSVYYTFIYVIMVQQDYALLLGSIGLFVVVAALMYFSRNISWYKQEATQ